MSTGTRKISIGDRVIENWYDRHTRNWITQLKDADLNELECTYSGNENASLLAYGDYVSRASRRQLRAGRAVPVPPNKDFTNDGGLCSTYPFNSGEMR